jgi:hypothetical protein
VHYVCPKTASGLTLHCGDEVSNLGTLMVCSHIFKCSLSHAKQAFYSADNFYICTLTSEEVIMQRLQSKRITVLIYWFRGVFALNCCNYKVFRLQVNRFKRELFRTSNASILKEEFQPIINSVLPSAKIANWTHKLEPSVGKVSQSYAYFIGSVLFVFCISFYVLPYIWWIIN